MKNIHLFALLILYLSFLEIKSKEEENKVNEEGFSVKNLHKSNMDLQIDNNDFTFVHFCDGFLF